MIEPLTQQDIEVTAANVLPFPAASTESATSKPQLYTAEELKEIFTPEAQTTRTVRDLVAKVRKAYHWLNELSFKRGNSFTQFVVDQIRIMKESGLTHEQWITEIQSMNPNQFKSAEPQPSPEVEVEVIEDESVSAITRIKQDRYAITSTGTSRLARATQTRQSQRSSLLETRERVRQAFLGLAVQTQEAHEAQELEGEARFEEIFEQTYAQRLEELQVANAARDAADADFATLQERMKGKQPGNGAAAVS